MKSRKPTPTYDEAIEVKTEAQAKAYMLRLIDHCLQLKPHLSRRRAIEIQRSNLGYIAGYYDAATRERVERLYKCEHPVFGSIKKNGQPTSEQAFKMGMAMGKKAKQKKR